MPKSTSKRHAATIEKAIYESMLKPWGLSVFDLASLLIRQNAV
jgi:hypothetical protein